jgi:hypothetical protein
MAVLHGSTLAWTAPYPRRISGSAFELRATEFGVLSQTFGIFRLLADFATWFSNKQATGWQHTGFDVPQDDIEAMLADLGPDEWMETGIAT